MKKGIALLGSLVIIMVLAACGDTNEAGSEAEDTVRIGFQKGNSLHILKTLGYLDETLEEEGINVEWKELPTGGALLEALNAESIDFGHAADANAVFAQAAGVPLVYVASAYPNPEGLAIITHEDSDIQSVTDLQDKTVAIGKGWNSHYLLLKALQNEGLTAEDVDFAWVKDASEGRASFESNEVDALGFWDPFLASLELDIGAQQVFNGDGFTNNRTYYFSSDDFANNESELLQTILEEVQRSDEWANNNKEELAQMLADELGLEVAPIQKMVDRKTYGVEKVTPEVTAEQQDIADVFFEEELIEEEINVSDMVTEDPAWFPESLE